MAKALWASWGLFVDPGTHTGISVDERWGVKATGVIFSLMGFTFWLVVLGLVVDLMHNLLNTWKKRSFRIVMNDHTLILGWTPKTAILVKELCMAAESRGGAKIIVMGSDTSPEVMRMELLMGMGDKGFRGSVVKAWEGEGERVRDLMRVCVNTAKASRKGGRQFTHI